MSVIDFSGTRGDTARAKTAQGVRPALSLVPGCGAAFVPHDDFWAWRAAAAAGAFLEPGVDLDPSLLAAARGLKRAVVMCLDGGTVAGWVKLLMMEADRVAEARADVMPDSEGEATLLASEARLRTLAMLIAQSGCPLDPGPPTGGPGGGVPVRMRALEMAA